MANLLATNQVNTGDTLYVDWDARVGPLVFWKESDAVSKAVQRQQPVQFQVMKAVGGRPVEAPSAAKARGAANK